MNLKVSVGIHTVMPLATGTYHWHGHLTFSIPENSHITSAKKYLSR